jgi:transposase
MSHQPKPPVESLSEAEWITLSANVQAVVIGLVEENRQLKLMVSKLEDQLRRNSGNSSQPPSQDKPEQKQSQEEKAGAPRQRGGQVGHVGRGRALIPVEAVDYLVVHRPVQCRVCGALLLGYDATPHRHQITELPSLKATVTEHQVHTLTGGCCGATNRGTLPAEVAASQFGPNVVSLMAVLMGCYRLSKRQVVDLLATCLGIQLAASSVVNQQQVISAALSQPVDELQTYVQQQPACNVDETSWRQAEQTKQSWLWVVVTTLVTVFHIVPSRSGAIARQLLGEDYAGVVGTDRASAYHWLDPTQGQLCWSHLPRDFQKILERGGQSYPIGYHLKLHADYLLALWARVRDGTLPYSAFLAEFPAIQCHVRYWLTQGLLRSCENTAETCRRLIALDTAVQPSVAWAFVTAPAVEPTNNAAERALRHPVLWRRTSHGTHSDHGRLFVQRMLTVADTCRHQHRSVFAFVRSARLAYRAGYPAPSLVPR